MSQRYWKPGAYGLWSKPSDWVGGVPAAGSDLASFAASAGHDDTITGNGTAGEILVSTTGTGLSTVTFTGTVTTTGTTSSSLIVDHNGQLVVAASATVDASSVVVIGQSGNATLSVAGHVVAAGLVLIGDLTSGVGHVDITAAGNLTAGTLVVGNHGSGTVTVDASGGAFGSDDIDASGTIYVGRFAGSHGTIDLVRGSLSPNSQQGGLVIGSGGSGLVIVSAQAGVYGGYDVQSHGEVRMYGGFLGGFFGTVEAGGVVDGSGQITTLGVVNDGVIRATGDLLLNSRGQGEGPDTISGTGVLAVEAHATLDVTNVFLSGQAVTFLGSAATLAIPSAFTGTPIGGFALGDVIRPDETVTSIQFHTGSDQLTLLAKGAVVDTLHFAGSFAGEHFVLGHDSAGALITLAATPAAHPLG